MSVCTLTPIVRVYEDFDKMSASEMCGAGGPCPSDSEGSGDHHMPKKAQRCSSNDETSSPSSASSADSTKSKRPLRKLSDGRKRSTSNLFHKCSKAFAETHPPAPSSHMQPSASHKTNADHQVAVQSEVIQLPKLTFTPKRSLHPANVSGGLRRQLLSRRSPSPNPSAINSQGQSSAATMSPGYVQYQRSLLEVPMPRDYGDASSDDLSSEWDSDVPAEKISPKVIISCFFLNCNFMM